MSPKRRAALGALLAVLTLAGGCAGVSGQPQTVGDVAGLPVTHFESGLKPEAPKPSVEVRGLTEGDEDRLAASAVADVEAYWAEHLPALFDGQQFEPVKTRMSYDSRSDAESTGCGSTKDLVNAFYCPPDDSIAWDRGKLLPMLRKQFGPMSVVTVLAHEYGHAVQYRLGKKAGVDKSTKTIVKEQQADCFAGSYFRWMAENKSKYFRVSTSEGINQVLASLFFIRDEAGESANDKKAHGSAFDRTYAFQVGFQKGPKDCAAIDQKEVDGRITEKSFEHPDDQRSKGDTKIDQNLDLLQRSLDDAFAGAGVQPPKITQSGGTCQNGPSTPPATYCPGNNTVSIDLAALSALGQPIDRDAELKGEKSAGLGDFAAFAEIASRYTQGIQKGVGASLDNANAGLRTSCLVGAWAAAADRDGAKLRLSPGDLDEAIAELLQPRSLIAADVNGAQVANGFARVESLRNGFLQGSKTCTERYG